MRASAPEHKPDAAKSEAQFLDDQAAAARLAIEDTLARMRETLKDGADIRAWAQKYPWATVGASAAAGFLLASALRPKRHAENDTEPALLERILADEQIAERIKQISAEEETRPRRGGMLQSVGATLLKTFGPALQSAIASALAARAAAPDPEEVAAAAEEGAARGEAEHSEDAPPHE